MNPFALLPRTLVARVFLLYSAAMLLFVGVGFGVFVVHTANRTLQETDEEGAAIMAILSPAMAESAVIGDYDTIKRALERVAEHPAFSRASFIDLKGARVEVSRRNSLAWLAPSWLQRRIEERLTEVNTPIVAGGRDYGVLRLQFWSERVASDTWHQTLMAMALALASLVSGVVLVWFPLKRWLGNLGRIQAFGQELAQAGGQLSHVVDEAAPLEFRQTFEVLNRAAASLQVERAQASVTLGAIADGVATLNREGEVVLANPVLCEMLNRDSPAVLGQRLQALFPDLVPESGLDNKPWCGRRIRIESAGQLTRVLEASLAVVSAEGDSTAGWVLALRDVTEQQLLEDRLRAELTARASAMAAMRELLESARTEAQDLTLRQRPDSESDIEQLSQLVTDMVQHLRRQAGQLNAIFSLSPDGFVSFDEHRRVHFVSPAFSRLIGISVTQAMDLPEAALQGLLQARQTDKRARLLDFEALCQGRLNLEINSPSPRMLELALHQGEDGGITQVLHVRDVTHQFEVDRMKNEFLATAAHELRTPMASIYGYTELLMTRQMSPERQQQTLETIYRQSQVMNAFVNDLLELARIDAMRGQDVVCEPLALQPLSQPCWVMADRDKLRHALRNELSNAYKFSPEGGAVRVQVQTLPHDEAAWVSIDVRDEGMGMSAEVLAHVTERFYRADKSGARLGTGLVMSIVKEYLELMGGRLQLQSTPGQGSTVQLCLPEVNQRESAPAAALEEGVST